ncbi:MAG: GHKL domain-containing protein [Alteromonadaceae bacterium]|nr:GHKL domain-containing protein [Alteromonadaceae bacterium]
MSIQLINTRNSAVSTSVYLLRSGLFLLFLSLVSLAVWRIYNHQQLQLLKQSAQSDLALYQRKIQNELDNVQPDLLPLIANHPILKKFLLLNTPVTQQRAQHYLNQLQATMVNRTLFIGNTKQLLIAAKDSNNDFAMIDSIRQRISSRAFKNKKTEQLIFSQAQITAKYLIALPVFNTLNIDKKQNKKICGYIGLLIDLSALQTELSQSLFNKQTVVLVSDPRGIVMLSSEPDWLYQTFSNLPYALKKQLDKNFVEKKLFNQLGIVNIDNDILTTAINKKNPQGQQFLVRSSILSDHPLRVHHLTNIMPLIKQSRFNVAFILICIILLSLFWLFIKEKRQAKFKQQQHQRVLKDLDIELKQQQKLASLGMMATTIAHDINQPITSIKTEASIANKYLARENYQEVAHSLSHIINATALLAAISSQLKGFACKRSPSQHNSTNLYQAINYSLSLFKARFISEHIHCALNEFDHNLAVVIDHNQLQQVMNNLLQNACDALCANADKKIEIKVSFDAITVIVFISDNGSGVKQEIKDDIFSPFISSKENASSLGLGLAICQDILSKVGGSIELLAQPINEGFSTSFKISLLQVTTKN